MHYLWAILGIFSVGLAAAGIVLPLLPTVPFILLASFCFARSSPRLHNWLLAHKTFGPMIEDWNRSGAINPQAKKWATVSVAFVFALSLALKAPTHVLIIQAIVLSAVMLFIWTRPNA
ncbi:YbaN family protein [Primorskyibacter sp. S87]|uniref:YbaN family protein n=1 Tax=Primorskyibacter sp. S87 TaxID=3415126 RepID=UPI003C7B8315